MNSNILLQADLPSHNKKKCSPPPPEHNSIDTQPHQGAAEVALPKACRKVASAVFGAFVMFFNQPVNGETNFAHIQVKSEPGVQIFLDGDFKGITKKNIGGLIIENTLPGNHTIKAVKAGFNAQETTVNLKDGKVFLFSVQQFVPEITITEQGAEENQQVARKVGKLMIQSLPIECHIEIPEIGVSRDKKKDEMTLSKVPAGKFNITFSALGKTLRGNIEIIEGQTVYLFANVISDKISIRKTSENVNGAHKSKVIDLVQVPSGKLSNNTATLIVGEAFCISKTEVTLDQWSKVRDWANKNGYDLKMVSPGESSPNHPVAGLSWHDAVKWCNALSEMEGMSPSYFSGSIVYRRGNHLPTWNRESEGYRLPTAGEWFFAACGGPLTKRFRFSGSENLDEVAWCSLNSNFKSHPVGEKKPNELGLHDMSGNLSEWCWGVAGYWKIREEAMPLQGGNFSLGLDHSGFFLEKCANGFLDKGDPSRGFRPVSGKYTLINPAAKAD